jgi:3-oxoacid CoA-transferase
MSTSDVIYLLDSIQNSSFLLLEQVQTLTSLIEKSEDLDPDYLFSITLIQNNIQEIKKHLKQYPSPFSLKRSKSAEAHQKNSSFSMIEAVKFFSVGRHLLDPLNQEKFQEDHNENKSLQEFLSLYNSFSFTSGEKIFKKLKDLEVSLKLFIKKSNKTTITRKSSYGMNSMFCDKFISWISRVQKPLIEELETRIFDSSMSKSLVSEEFARKSSSCKIFSSIDEAIFDIQDSCSIIVGGFGVVGTPEGILRGIHRKGVKNLNIATCLAGTRDSALGDLVQSKRVKRLHISHIGSNTAVEEQFLSGDLEVEFTTQGTLVEKFRASSMGIHSFYTPSGSGTFVEKGAVPIKFSSNGKPEKFTVPKSFIQDNGKKFFLEKAESGDFAIIKAWRADKAGNLVFRRTARNSNPDIAGSCPVTIVEVEELLEEGEIDPDQIHVPGIFVQRVVLSDSKEKFVERLSFRKDGGIHIPGSPEQIRKREVIARRAAREIREGMYVNLGIGIPTLIPNFLPDEFKIVLHGENGVLGIGPYPEEGMHDPDTVNAGRETITINPGGSTFSSSDSFGIIRGNHLDITFLGGLQVSQFGDLANWIVPHMKVKGMGGAVDLVCSKAKCIVCMEHLVFGNMKILKKCKLPLTGKMVVDKLITDLAVFEFTKEGMILVEIAEGVSVDALRAKTQADFKVSDKLSLME